MAPAFTRRELSLWPLASVLAAAIAVPAAAQHTPIAGGAPPPATPPREASQWDFLIGQWELEVSPKVGNLAALLHGAPKLGGVWKAWRAFDGFGIEDELRIVDASGNPVTLTHTLRLWDTRNRRWLLQGLDVYRARASSAQAAWADGEMRGQGSGTSPEGKPMLTRTRFFDIGGSGFRMKQDRSSDDGASWDEGVLTIGARRVAAKAAR